jgi:hypothetical protein
VVAYREENWNGRAQWWGKIESSIYFWGRVVFVVLRAEPRTLHMLDKHCTTEIYF